LCVYPHAKAVVVEVAGAVEAEFGVDAEVVEFDLADAAAAVTVDSVAVVATLAPPSEPVPADEFLAGVKGVEEEAGVADQALSQIAADCAVPQTAQLTDSPVGEVVVLCVALTQPA
jgi:hypothetical protein